MAGAGDGAELRGDEGDDAGPDGGPPQGGTGGWEGDGNAQLAANYPPNPEMHDRLMLLPDCLCLVQMAPVTVDLASPPPQGRTVVPDPNLWRKKVNVFNWFDEAQGQLKR